MLEQVENYEQEIKFITGFAGCVDGETEYLTKTGWKCIKDFNKEEIAIVNKPSFKGSQPYITWQKPLGYIKNSLTDAWHIRNRDRRSSIDMVLTDGHTVPYYSSKGNWVTDTMGNIADTLLSKPNGTRGKSTCKAHIPVGFKIKTKGLDINSTDLRLWLAIQADGSLLDGGVRFNLKKNRKIERLRWLLDTLGIVYSDRALDNGYTTIMFYGQFLFINKDLTPLYECNQEEAEIVYDEIVHWDGSLDSRTGNHRYSCTDKKNIDVIQYCMSVATGNLCSISIDDRVGELHEVGGKEYTRVSIGYTVSKTNLVKNKWFNKDLERVKIQGSWCFTTSTGLWLARRNNYIFVTGNSGKSTRLASMVTPTTLVMTPTHKAADVLSAKGVKAFTIHSVLGLVPTINENFRKGQRLQTLRKIGGTDLKDITDVYIDEFSMISMDILDHLLEVLPKHCKVTVFGDPYQLPPVSGEAIDPLYYTDDIEDLQIQHRADNPHIVETFMRFKEYIRTGDNSISLVLNPKIPKGSLDSFVEGDRALAYTNAKVLNMNDSIAKHLGLDETIQPLDEILVGDMLGTLGGDEVIGIAFPATTSKGKMMEGADFEQASQKTLADMSKYRTDMAMYTKEIVIIDEKGYIIFSDRNHYANGLKLKQEVEKYQGLVVSENGVSKEIKIADWCRVNKQAPFVKERAKAWSDYLKHQNLVFGVRRPFSTTIHKAQGQEFSTVFIAQNDIKKSIRNGYYETYARLMYVALSRAINKVVIV